MLNFSGPFEMNWGETLQTNQSYPCPVCRHGQIAKMVMMEAWACNFCRHILTQEGSQPILRLEDSNLNCRWRWQGQTWRSVRLAEVDVTLAVWLVALALSVLPPSLVWLSYHTFPPLPDSPFPWFPQLWVGMTLLAHLLLVGWILLEHHQVTPYLAWRVRWLRRRFNPRP
jgi:hypothetical protein